MKICEGGVIFLRVNFIHPLATFRQPGTRCFADCKLTLVDKRNIKHTTNHVCDLAGSFTQIGVYGVLSVPYTPIQKFSIYSR